MSGVHSWIRGLEHHVPHDATKDIGYTAATVALCRRKCQAISNTLVGRPRWWTLWRIWGFNQLVTGFTSLHSFDSKIIQDIFRQSDWLWYGDGNAELFDFEEEHLLPRSPRRCFLTAPVSKSPVDSVIPVQLSAQETDTNYSYVISTNYNLLYIYMMLNAYIRLYIVLHVYQCLSNRLERFANFILGRFGIFWHWTSLEEWLLVNCVHLNYPVPGSQGPLNGVQAGWRWRKRVVFGKLWSCLLVLEQTCRRCCKTCGSLCGCVVLCGGPSWGPEPVGI